MEAGRKTQRIAYRAIRAIFPFVVLALTIPACAQGNMTIEFRSRDIRNLAGVVTFSDRAVVAGAIVADCDSTYTRVLASTKTDATGRFSLPNAMLGSKHFLKVDFPNFQEVHMPVRISPTAKAELRISLTPGT